MNYQEKTNNIPSNCRFCSQLRPLNIASVCGQCTNDIFSHDGKATVQGIAKLLKVSTAALKRLESTGQLPAERSDVGTRRYTKQAIETYFIENEDKLFAKLSKYSTIGPSVDVLEAPIVSFEAMCQRCGESGILHKNYCQKCFADFISKPEAATLMKITVRNVDRLLEKYPEELKSYNYMAQVRLSRREVLLFLIRHQDIKIATEPKWSGHFLKCRSCKTVNNKHYGGGYCLECYPKSNEAKIIHGYMNGKTLAEVGRNLGMSRERARQLFNKALEIDTLRIDGNPSAELRSSIAAEIHSAYLLGKSIKEYKNEIENRYEDIVKIIVTKNITSERSMLRAVGLPPSAIYVIQEEYSEFLELLSANEDRWSWKYDSCKKCGTTSVKHARWGYCKNCFASSPEHRAQQYRYRMNNYDEFRKKQKAYESEYYKRPEVKKRMNEKSYDKRYDGKREKTIILAGEMCQDCRMSRNEHKEKFDEDLSVLHLDGDIRNNDQSNLASLCRSCRSKRVYKTFRV